MRIEGQHRDTRAADDEVVFQGLVEQTQFAEYPLFRDEFGHLSQRHMVGDEGDAHLVAYHHHQ